MGLRCCARAFSGCGERGLLFVAVHGLLIAVAFLLRRAGASGVAVCGLSCSAACEISPDQGSNRVPCIGRHILNHCATREVPTPFFGLLFPWIFFFFWFFFLQIKLPLEFSIYWKGKPGSGAYFSSWALVGLLLLNVWWLPCWFPLILCYFQVHIFLTTLFTLKKCSSKISELYTVDCLTTQVWIVWVHSDFFQ